MVQRKDFYFKEAKKLGYRARSAFKLLQIQRRFGILKKGDRVLDLGASPGSWCQVAKEFVGDSGKVIGIDIADFKPLDGVLFIRGDITDRETRERLKAMLSNSRLDVVLSDLSPSTSGVHSLDHARSIWLAEHAFGYAVEFLKRGGNFVCKVFEGEDLKVFLEKVENHFLNVRCFSPKASRKKSSEIYIIAKGFRPPEKEI